VNYGSLRRVFALDLGLTLSSFRHRAERKKQNVSLEDDFTDVWVGKFDQLDARLVCQPDRCESVTFLHLVLLDYFELLKQLCFGVL